MSDQTPSHEMPPAYMEGTTAIFRAFAIGHCAKALAASLQGYGQLPPPPDMAQRFAMGHKHEPQLLQAVANEGWHLYGEQTTLELPIGDHIIIRGHPDSLATHPTHGIAVVEAKALAKSNFDKWVRDQFKYFPHYMDQTTVYWDVVKPQALIMVVGCKSPDGESLVDINIRTFWEPPGSISRIKARVAKIANIAASGTLPDTCDKSDYPCPVSYLHTDAPDVVAEMVDEAIRLEMEDAVTEYAASAAAEKSAKDSKAKARDRLLELLKQVDTDRAQAGGYVIHQYTSTKRVLDESAAAADGIDLSKYKIVKASTVLTVKEA